MRLGKYVMDKLAELLIAAFALLVVCGMLLLCRAPSALVAAVCVVWLAAAAAIFAVSYGKKHRFYQELVRNAERLDQKYLVLETIQEPHFYEGEIVYQVIYEADKSMTENVKKYRRSIEDFKDYVECGYMRSSFRLRAYSSCATITGTCWIRNMRRRSEGWTITRTRCFTMSAPSTHTRII